MAFVQYIDYTYSQKLGRPVKAERVSDERYNWIQANLPKLANNHNEDLTETQVSYLLSIKKAWPSKDFTRGIREAENAPETAGEHLTNTGIYQSKDMALPENDR